MNRTAAFSVYVSECWKHRRRVAFPFICTRIPLRNFVNQIYAAIRAAGKSRAVFGPAFGAEHDHNHIPHAIPAVSGR